jgi:chromosome segregation ATPase
MTEPASRVEELGAQIAAEMRATAAALQEAQEAADRLRREPTEQHLDEAEAAEKAAKLHRLQVDALRKKEAAARRAEAEAELARLDGEAHAIEVRAQELTDGVVAATEQLEAAFEEIRVADRKLKALSKEANEHRATLKQETGRYQIALLAVEGLRRRLEAMPDAYDVAKAGFMARTPRRAR